MGRSSFEPKTSTAVPRAPKPLKAESRRWERLSARQKQIAILIARDYPNKAIAQELGLKENTIVNHRVAIYRILDIGIGSGIRLTHFLYALGMADPLYREV